MPQGQGQPHLHGGQQGVWRGPRVLDEGRRRSYCNAASGCKQGIPACIIHRGAPLVHLTARPVSSAAHFASRPFQRFTLRVSNAVCDVVRCTRGIPRRFPAPCVTRPPSAAASAQHPANALVHRPLLLTYVLNEQIKVCGDEQGYTAASCDVLSWAGGPGHRLLPSSWGGVFCHLQLAEAQRPMLRAHVAHAGLLSTCAHACSAQV